MNPIIISPPEKIPGEMEVLEALVEAGLERFHFRRDVFNYQETVDYLSNLSERARSRIILHAYPGLVEEYGLLGVHFPEHVRKQLDESTKKDWLDEKESRGILLGTSIHDPKTLDTLPDWFDYVFLSPLFESISKEGYKPMYTLDVSPWKDKVSFDIIGLGGITKNNLSQVKEWGFDGVGALGSIWKDRHAAVDTYLQLKEKWQSLVPMS